MLISFQTHRAPGLKSKSTFVFICLLPIRFGLLDLSLMLSLRYSELKCVIKLLFVERFVIKINTVTRLFGQGLCSAALLQQLDGGK